MAWDVANLPRTVQHEFHVRVQHSGALIPAARRAPGLRYDLVSSLPKGGAMSQRLRPGTRATLQVRQLMPGQFAWIITLLDPETGNVRSTNYSEIRFASQDEASAAGKAAVMKFLGGEGKTDALLTRDAKLKS